MNVEEIFHETRDVFLALPEGRQAKMSAIQTEVQFTAEAAPFGFYFKVASCRRDKPCFLPGGATRVFFLCKIGKQGPLTEQIKILNAVKVDRIAISLTGRIAFQVPQ